jgi:hypothetical protein
MQDLRKQGGNADGNITVEAPLAGNMELSATLWFDKMSNENSFMLEKELLPTSVSGLKDKASMLAEAKEESVQLEVEGFIAALRNPYTRFVTLHWADFSFTGSISSIVATYTMFSMSGLPVRAKVSIRLRQEIGSKSVEAWQDDFDTAFGGDQSNLVRAEQRVSNILNFHL